MTSEDKSAEAAGGAFSSLIVTPPYVLFLSPRVCRVLETKFLDLSFILLTLDFAAPADLWNIETGIVTIYLDR